MSHRPCSKLVGFRYKPDKVETNENQEERYQRLRDEYKDKNKLFKNLDAILNDPCPLERLRRNLNDQDCDQKHKDEVMRIFATYFRKFGINMY